MKRNSQVHRKVLVSSGVICDALDDGFVQIPNDLVLNPGISALAVRALAVAYTHYDGKPFPIEEILTALGVTHKTLRIAFSNLIEHGYLRRHQTRVDGRDFGPYIHEFTRTPFSWEGKNDRALKLRAEQAEQAKATESAGGRNDLPPLSSSNTEEKPSDGVVSTKDKDNTRGQMMEVYARLRYAAELKQLDQKLKRQIGELAQAFKAEFKDSFSVKLFEEFMTWAIEFKGEYAFKMIPASFMKLFSDFRFKENIEAAKKGLVKPKSKYQPERMSANEPVPTPDIIPGWYRTKNGKDVHVLKVEHDEVHIENPEQFNLEWGVAIDQCYGWQRLER